MVRRTMAYILIALLSIGAFPAAASEPTIAEQVARLKVDRKVRVKLKTGEILKGRMASVAPDQFTVNLTDHASAQIVRFDDAQSVKPDGLSAKYKWIIVGAVVWVAIGIISKATI
jgi:small nuclear ribonucleoprotein (snRNP)-like protein